LGYKLVVFDFDGTLADSFPFFRASLGTLADAHGFRRLRDEDLDALRGLDARQLMRHVGLPVWKVPRVAMHFRRLMAQQAESIPLFEGVSGLLQELAARGVALAVLSSNSRDNVEAVLGAEHTALIKHFDCGVSLFGKRNKLRGLLARTGVAPADAICVGDEIRDIQAARGVPVAIAAVGWGYTRPDALAEHRPDALVATVAQLRALLGAA
jgi:phosphoglycolate phosphatase